MQAARNTRVLIAGAGIAGPSLAFWLLRRGFQPTLVESAPALRTGGYMIDFWGSGYDVAERMHLVAALKRQGYAFTEVRLVDARGKAVGGFNTRALDALLDGRFFSILRADLAGELFRAVANDVEALFGTRIAGIEQSADAVRVEFAGGAERAFDLVIGADGLHSSVRKLVFGPEQQFEKYLGYYAASFIADDYPQRTANVYVSHAAPGRQIARYWLRGESGGRTAFLFIFARTEKLDIAQHDTAAQKQILRNIFENDGWEAGAILEAMAGADELYFDCVSQIRLPQWSSGRVALVGDAACCPSLLAGEGAALAMTGAYLLAGELHRAGGDHALGFANYESRFRPFIAGKQRGAERLAGWFAPRTPFGIRIRNAATRMMGLPLIGPWMFRRMLTDNLPLPDYDVFSDQIMRDRLSGE